MDWQQEGVVKDLWQNAILRQFLFLEIYDSSGFLPETQTSVLSPDKDGMKRMDPRIKTREIKNNTNPTYTKIPLLFHFCLMRFDEVCRFAVQGNDPCTFGSTRSPGAAAARVVWSPGFMLCYQRLGRCQDAWDLFWFWWILLVCLSLSFWERFGSWNHEWK